MPRLSRTICVGVPHHVTQRGNRREQVFFSDADCLAYLHWLREYTETHAVAVLAYCLMVNHVHLVLVPATADGLYRVLRPLHMRHAQRVNRARGWQGHVWQGRFFSSALDEPHLWAAIRYVERNPVRAKLVERAEDYSWSSAAGHCGRRPDPLLSTDKAWQRRLKGLGDWSTWLAAGDDRRRVETLRRHAEKGLPCGSPAFIEALERDTGRMLRCRPQGRPTRPASQER